MSSAAITDSQRDLVRSFADQVVAAAAQVVVGSAITTRQFLVALLVGGHVLLEGVPGTAKTTLAKTFAHVLGIQYHRVQFTPDLLPSDITGAYIFDRASNEFQLRQGPIFCQLLLADEVNRAPAKTQSALLEAMQEFQTTIEGTTLPLPRPFFVLATQNPVEQEGVYRLPEAQLDRFLMRVEMAYPARETEIDILKLHSGLFSNQHETTDSKNGWSPPGSTPMPAPVCSAEKILELQALLPKVHAEPGIFQYIVDLARASREHRDVELGASPRAAVSLLQCARARALLAGRDYCTHEDIHSTAQSVLGHRVILTPEAEVEGRSVVQVVSELLSRIPVLKTESKTVNT